MDRSFKLEQYATSVPSENVLDYRVEQISGVMYIWMPDSWVRINLENDTFAIGAYEG